MTCNTCGARSAEFELPKVASVTRDCYTEQYYGTGYPFPGIAGVESSGRAPRRVPQFDGLTAQLSGSEFPPLRSPQPARC